MRKEEEEKMAQRQKADVKKRGLKEDGKEERRKEQGRKEGRKGGRKTGRNGVGAQASGAWIDRVHFCRPGCRVLPNLRWLCRKANYPYKLSIG